MGPNYPMTFVQCTRRQQRTALLGYCIISVRISSQLRPTSGSIGFSGINPEVDIHLIVINTLITKSMIPRWMRSLAAFLANFHFYRFFGNKTRSWNCRFYQVFRRWKNRILTWVKPEYSRSNKVPSVSLRELPVCSVNDSSDRKSDLTSWSVKLTR